MDTDTVSEHCPHVIPAWMLPFLALPFRRWFDRSLREILAWVRPGMRILEVGPGVGFYSIPLARALGPGGGLTCVELQAPAREGLRRRLSRRGLADRVEIRPCEPRDLDIASLAGTQDLALALLVLHEMPEPSRAIGDLARALRPGGRLLVLEPRGHCPAALFDAEAGWAEAAGLERERAEGPSRYLRASFRKPAP